MMLTNYELVTIGAGLGEMYAYKLTTILNDVLVHSSVIRFSDLDELVTVCDALTNTIAAVIEKKSKSSFPHTDFLQSIVYTQSSTSDICQIVYDFGNSRNTHLYFTQLGIDAILSGLQSWRQTCQAVCAEYERLLIAPETKRILFQYPE